MIAPLGCLCLFWSCHVFSSLWSNVSMVKILKDCSLKVFSKCICHGHCRCLCLCLCRCLFVGQVMFPHHSDQMSQRSKVSKIALWRYSLNVIVIVFVFAFVFVVVFLLVRSCFFMNPSVLQGFRFGLEGWKALNPIQPICRTVTSNKGRPRAARAAKNHIYTRLV